MYEAGNSAGANLAHGLTIHLRDTHSHAPEAVLLFAPFMDLTVTNPAMTALERHDPLLGLGGLRWVGEQWAGPLPPTDPRVNPLFDTLDRLPLLFIYQGTAPPMIRSLLPQDT